MMHSEPDITEPMQYNAYIVKMYCMHSMVKMPL